MLQTSRSRRDPLAVVAVSVSVIAFLLSVASMAKAPRAHLHAAEDLPTAAASKQPGPAPTEEQKAATPPSSGPSDIVAKTIVADRVAARELLVVDESGNVVGRISTGEHGTTQLVLTGGEFTAGESPRSEVRLAASFGGGSLTIRDENSRAAAANDFAITSTSLGLTKMTTLSVGSSIRVWQMNTDDGPTGSISIGGRDVLTR